MKVREPDRDTLTRYAAPGAVAGRDCRRGNGGTPVPRYHRCSGVAPAGAGCAHRLRGHGARHRIPRGATRGIRARGDSQRRVEASSPAGACPRADVASTECRGRLARHLEAFAAPGDRGGWLQFWTARVDRSASAHPDFGARAERRAWRDQPHPLTRCGGGRRHLRHRLALFQRKRIRQRQSGSSPVFCGPLLLAKRTGLEPEREDRTFWCSAVLRGLTRSTRPWRTLRPTWRPRHSRFR